MADEQIPKEGKAKQSDDSMGIGMLIGVFLVAFLLINGSMYFLLNHVRSTYVMPYYQLLMQDSLRQDSLARVTKPDSVQSVVAGLASDFIQSRRANDSLSQVNLGQKNQIDNLQSQVNEWEERDLKLNNEQIAKLAKIFGNMKPKNAAPIMEQMDDGSIVDVLFKVKERQAAKIMAAMPAPRAARLADRIQSSRDQTEMN